METIGFVRLEFDPQRNEQISGKKLTDGLSAVVQIGKTLWVANDETFSVERLFFDERGMNGLLEYGRHTSFPLKDFLILPVPPKPDEFEEADIEGLDCDSGYLWLVCSHSLKRKKADKTKKQEKNIENLAKVSSDGNRYLLARIPLEEVGDQLFTLKRKVVQSDGEMRTAAQLPGGAKSSQLTRLLEEDDHLKKFLGIPGKDNGFDIEGLAVAGNRVFIGLRGPVLRGWAIILELKVETDADPAFLTLLPIEQLDGTTRLYRKHFLELGGLGIRDLSMWGNDMLIMAGPTMDLDGPVTVFRWKNGNMNDRESMLFADEIIEVGSLPFGDREDHPEGMTWFLGDGLDMGTLLIVNDATANPLIGRKIGDHGFKADLFSMFV